MPGETAPADKRALIALTRRERGRLDDAVGALAVSRLTEPAFNDGWSVKDALAHVAAWEQRCLGWIKSSLRGERPADRREFEATY
ncbi:MAG TPA: maleylpyruvate isomerase N-terminal domain-containing protein, partial [Dehalococcoidia bacterium]|nr:maleylpyruvate isomerase N-terminal domain-containing protein [Dehalococcoidia bacterium]